MEQIQTEHPEATVELWAMDEHRIGLKPLLRRIWVRKGSRPRLSVQQRFEWMYLYGFVHPHSGRTEWLIEPPVDIETMNLALAHFARVVGANAQKHIGLGHGSSGVACQLPRADSRRSSSALFTTLFPGTPAQ